MVDDRDLAPPDALGEILGARTDARDPDDAQRRTAPAPPRAGTSLTVAPLPARASTRSSPERSTSSRAWRRACADPPTPASIREISLTRASSSSSAAPATVRPSDLVLRHEHVRVGERRDLREVRHAEHLVMAAQGRERAPDRGARLAADPGVDLVEHERRRRLGQHDAQRQHRARQLAARRGLGERPGGLARVGREQERDVVGAVVADRRGSVGRPGRRLDVDRERRGRQRELAEMRRSPRRRAAGAAARRAFDSARAARSTSASASRLRGIEARGARVVLLQLVEPGARSARRTSTTSASVGPYLRRSSASSARRVCTVLQPFRIGDDRLLGRCARRARPPASRPAGAADALAERVERRAPGQRRDRRAERVLARALELAVRAGQRLAVRLRVGEQLRFGQEPVVLARRRRSPAASISSTW